MNETKYEWMKVELFGRRERYGRCSIVEFLGVQMLRIEVPFPEPKFDEQRIPHFGEFDEVVKVEQFASVEEYGAAALYGRQILTEAEVRKALEPWRPTPRPALPMRTLEDEESVRREADTDWEDSAPIEPISGAELMERVEQLPRSAILDVWDASEVAPTQANRLAKIASANWSEHDLPGWRIISLASVGWRGVGRPDAAKRCDDVADNFKTDADALGYLAGFQWNELADLPFLIRDLLGIDKHGNWVDADDDGECPWLVDPLPGQDVSKAMQEVFTVDGDEDAASIVDVVSESDSRANGVTTVSATNNVEVFIEGYQCTVLTNLVRNTHKNGVAGFYSIVVEGKRFCVWGVWDNEYEEKLQPHLFERVLFMDGEWRTNEQECSLILIDGDEESETLFAEHVARELAQLPRVGEDVDNDLAKKREKDRQYAKLGTCDNGKTWSYEFPDVDNDKMVVRAPQISVTSTDAIAELMVDVNGHTLDVWCPNYAQLEALYDRIEEILKAELLKQGRAKTDFTVVFRETVEWSNGAIGWFDERTNEWNIVKRSSDTRDHFAMLDEIYKRAAKEPRFIELEGKLPFDMSEGYETTQEKVDEAVERTVSVMQRGTVILENGNKATLHDGAITEHGNDGPVRGEGMLP